MNCGQTITSNHADRDQINMSIITTVRPVAGGGSEVETLLTAQGAVVSSEELLDRVWDENADPFTTTVRVTMMTLRRKLGEPPIIATVVGSGYRIDPGARVPYDEEAGSVP